MLKIVDELHIGRVPKSENNSIEIFMNLGSIQLQLGLVLLL